MEFSLDQIAKLAKLSRLAMDESELKSMQSDLQKVVSYIDMLAQVDVSGIKPMAHAMLVDTPMRADEKTVVAGQKALSQSSAYAEGFISVPKIIE